MEKIINLLFTGAKNVELGERVIISVYDAFPFHSL